MEVYKEIEHIRRELGGLWQHAMRLAIAGNKPAAKRNRCRRLALMVRRRALIALLAGLVLAACGVEVDVPKASIPGLTPPAGACEREIWELCLDYGYVNYRVGAGYLDCVSLDRSATPVRTLYGAADLTAGCIAWGSYGGGPQ